MIYIIRHGKTEMNKANVLQGRSDHPLNEDGILQAKTAADKLKDIHFDHVFSSPLTRAVQTARIIAPHMTPIIEERLIEMDYGPYEGTDLNNLPPEILTFFSDFVHNPAPDGMEQLSSVIDRAGSFLEEIRSLSGNILISTHAIAMKGLLEYLTPESNGSYWSKYIGNCAVYTAENDNGQIGEPKELKDWSSFTHEEKNHQLFLKQKALLDQFLEKGAISRKQHDKSLHDLTEKMGESEDGESV